MYYLNFAHFHMVNFTGPVQLVFDSKSDAPNMIANLTNLDIVVWLTGYIQINTEQFKSNVTLQRIQFRNVTIAGNFDQNWTFYGGHIHFDDFGVGISDPYISLILYKFHKQIL